MGYLVQKDDRKVVRKMDDTRSRMRLMFMRKDRDIDAQKIKGIVMQQY